MCLDRLLGEFQMWILRKKFTSRRQKMKARNYRQIIFFLPYQNSERKDKFASYFTWNVISRHRFLPLTKKNPEILLRFWHCILQSHTFKFVFFQSRVDEGWLCLTVCSGSSQLKPGPSKGHRRNFQSKLMGEKSIYMKALYRQECFFPMTSLKESDHEIVI